ncbi:unnamed protein product [Amoebophrya sp. A25]|nr:unnamed protein product [Amoebophrya sp. A25]|eukprot:GSA25T00000568001.1
MAPPRRRDARSKQSFFRRHRFFLGVVVATHNVAGGRIKSRSAVAKAPVTRPRGQELEASEQRKKVKLMPSTRNSRENEENETGQEGHDEQIKSKQEEAVEADDDNNPRANDEDKSVEEDGDEAIPSSLDEQENNKNNMNKEGRHHQANEDKRGATEDDGRKSAASRASTAEFKNKIPMSSFSRQAKTGSSSSATGRVGIRGHHHAVDKEIDAVEEDERKVGRDEDDIDEDDQDQREESRRGRRSRTKSSVRHEELQVQGDGDQDEDSEDTTKRGSSKYQVGMLNVDEEQNIDSLEQGDKNRTKKKTQRLWYGDTPWNRTRLANYVVG